MFFYNCHSQELFNRLSLRPRNHCSLGSSMSHEECLYHCHIRLSFAHLYLSFMWIYSKPPVNLSRVPLSLWILFIVMDAYSWKDSRRAVIMSDPLIFLILSFRPARETAYFTEGWCWLKDAFLKWRDYCLPQVPLKMYFICILILNLHLNSLI